MLFGHNRKSNVKGKPRGNELVDREHSNVPKSIMFQHEQQPVNKRNIYFLKISVVNNKIHKTPQNKFGKMKVVIKKL